MRKTAVFNHGDCNVLDSSSGRYFERYVGKTRGALCDRFDTVDGPKGQRCHDSVFPCAGSLDVAASSLIFGLGDLHNE
jgi:hypothetical protein